MRYWYDTKSKLNGLAKYSIVLFFMQQQQQQAIYTKTAILQNWPIFFVPAESVDAVYTVLWYVVVTWVAHCMICVILTCEIENRNRTEKKEENNEEAAFSFQLSGDIIL